MIIGISGQISSGKDTVAKMIQYLTSEHGKNKTRTFEDSQDKIDSEGYGYLNFYQYNSPFHIKKFAGKLKKIVSLLTGCTLSDLENEDFKNSFLPKEWNINGKQYTYREVLQKLGTELLRDGLHKNVHINALYADYIPELGEGWIPTYSNPDNHNLEQPAEPVYPDWILTDLRFENEFDSIKERNGICLRIERMLTFNQWAQLLGIENIPYYKDNDIHFLNKTQFIRILQDCDYKNDKFYNKHLHTSETSLNHHFNNNLFDYVIENDGTLLDLQNKVEIFLKQYQII